jgi:hypothetical protein
VTGLMLAEFVSNYTIRLVSSFVFSTVISHARNELIKFSLIVDSTFTGLPNLPPNFKDAQVFEQFAKQQAISSTEQPSTALKKLEINQ